MVRHERHSSATMPSSLFATVQKIRSHLARSEVDGLVSASASECVCLRVGHTSSRAVRSETGSNHTDRCDGIGPPNPGSGRTSPLHAPTHMPNSSPAITVLLVLGDADGF